MNFDPEFVEFVQWLLIIVSSQVIAFFFGAVMAWIVAWTLVGVLDFFTDDLKEFKRKFKYRKRAWRPPEHPPL